MVSKLLYLQFINSCMHERDLSEVTPLGDNGCIGDRKVRMHTVVTLKNNILIAIN